MQEGGIKEREEKKKKTSVTGKIHQCVFFSPFIFPPLHERAVDKKIISIFLFSSCLTTCTSTQWQSPVVYSVMFSLISIPCVLFLCSFSFSLRWKSFYYSIYKIGKNKKKAGKITGGNSWR